MPQAKISSTKQKNYPDLGSNTLSAQNFFTHSSHVILQGNQQQYEQNDCGLSSQVKKEKYSTKQRTTLTVAPIAFGGRLCLNLARTTPLFPWGLITFPHITRILLAFLSPLATVFLLARYTNATRLPR